VAIYQRGDTGLASGAALVEGGDIVTEMVWGKVQRDGGRETVCCREGVCDGGWIEAEMGLEDVEERRGRG
jgi:hypothetical protein